MRILPSAAALSGLGGLAAACLCPSPALAGSASQSSVTGKVQANVVEPMDIRLLDNMRFGAFISPAAGGTIAVAPDGTVSTASGMTGQDAISQPSSGRGPAAFRLNGTKNRFFIAKMPKDITISNGGASMLVSNITANVKNGKSVFDADGMFTLKVGGTLNVNANQQTGSYSGTFQVTVLYQ